MNRRLIAAPIAGLVLLAACSNGPGSKENQVAKQQLAGFNNNQPVPVFTYSQLRQNLIELETSQAQTTQTTSFFFNLGVPEPIGSCPSIGYPIPTTDQLTNPQQAVTQGNDGIATVGQIEANGVYTGDSSGTYVICVDASGAPYANYWEGFVQTVSGPAVWDGTANQVKLTGAPSATFSTAKK